MSYTGSVPDTEPARPWLESAACLAEGIHPDEMFPDNNAAGIAHARTICQTCPVRRACLIDCMKHEGGQSAKSRFGVYAGLTPRQRERLYHRLRGRAKASKPAPKAPPKKREPAKCGTRGGYQKHLREKTEVCPPCRQANTDADNRLRRTGTTKALAS